MLDVNITYFVLYIILILCPIYIRKLRLANYPHIITKRLELEIEIPSLVIVPPHQEKQAVSTSFISAASFFFEPYVFKIGVIDSPGYFHINQAFPAKLVTPYL